MSFQKNIHFTVIIKIEGRLKEFNFRKRGEGLYDTDTSDDKGNRWMFIWRLQGGNWCIEPKSANLIPLPAWLLENTSAIKEGFLTEEL